MRPGAEKVVQGLIEGDIFENVSEPTDWIAAGMFVKKANPYVKMEADRPPAEEKTPGNGKNSKTIADPTLVVHFSPLYKYVERPTCASIS